MQAARRGGEGGAGVAVAGVGVERVEIGLGRDQDARSSATGSRASPGWREGIGLIGVRPSGSGAPRPRRRGGSPARPQGATAACKRGFARLASAGSSETEKPCMSSEVIIGAGPTMQRDLRRRSASAPVPRRARAISSAGRRPRLLSSATCGPAADRAARAGRSPSPWPTRRIGERRPARRPARRGCRGRARPCPGRSGPPWASPGTVQVSSDMPIERTSAITRCAACGHGVEVGALLGQVRRRSCGRRACRRRRGPAAGRAARCRRRRSPSRRARPKARARSAARPKFSRSPV